MVHFLGIPVTEVSSVPICKGSLLTITHLVPSNANLDGFLPIKACGFEGLTGFLPAIGAGNELDVVIHTTNRLTGWRRGSIRDNSTCSQTGVFVGHLTLINLA